MHDPAAGNVPSGRLVAKSSFKGLTTTRDPRKTAGRDKHMWNVKLTDDLLATTAVHLWSEEREFTRNIGTRMRTTLRRLHGREEEGAAVRYGGQLCAGRHLSHKWKARVVSRQNDIWM